LFLPNQEGTKKDTLNNDSENVVIHGDLPYDYEWNYYIQEDSLYNIYYDTHQDVGVFPDSNDYIQVFNKVSFYIPKGFDVAIDRSFGWRRNAWGSEEVFFTRQSEAIYLRKMSEVIRGEDISHRYVRNKPFEGIKKITVYRIEVIPSTNENLPFYIKSMHNIETRPRIQYKDRKMVIIYGREAIIKIVAKDSHLPDIVSTILQSCNTENVQIVYSDFWWGWGIPRNNRYERWYDVVK